MLTGAPLCETDENGKDTAIGILSTSDENDVEEGKLYTTSYTDIKQFYPWLERNIDDLDVPDCQ